MKTKRITVKVTEHEHNLVKVKLAQLGKTMADWVREAIKELVER